MAEQTGILKITGTICGYLFLSTAWETLCKIEKFIEWQTGKDKRRF